MGKKNKELKQRLVAQKSASQAVSQNLRSSQKIKKSGKKAVGQNLLAISLKEPLMIADSTLFHRPIVYTLDSANGTLIFDSIADGGTIIVQNKMFVKDGLSLVIDKSKKVHGSIGQVSTLLKADSPDIKYSFIYLKTQTTTGKKVFLGLGTNSSSPPSGWNIKIAHDDFAGAFLGSDTSSSTTDATQNLVFSPTIGTITNFILSTMDQHGIWHYQKFGNPTVQ